MIIKIIIIGAILVLGGILLIPNNLNLVSNASKISDSLTHNIIEIKDDTVDKVENTIDSTTNKMSETVDKINPTNFLLAQGLSPQEQIFRGQVFSKNQKENTCNVSVPDMVQPINGKKELTHIITISDCKFEVNDPILVKRHSSSSSSDITNSLFNAQPTVAAHPVPPSLIFQTLSLTTMRDKNNDVMLHYEDTSGNTISVSVTLRNVEREVFSGKFFSSKFETSVNDVSDTPHIIEMIVEHAEYGIISSSVFNPAGNMDNTISGVFTQT